MIETLTAIGTGVAVRVISPIFTTTIKKAFSGLKSITPSLLKDFSYTFSEYIEYQKNRYECLNTIVFSKKVSLEKLYIPLTLVARNDPKNEITVSDFSMKFLPKHNRVLITDSAGMGKSTILKFLLLKCIESEYAIPIFIELRSLSSSKTLLDTIIDQLNIVTLTNNTENTNKLTKAHIERIIKTGDFIFFLDGYDEIPFKERENVTKSINEFISKFPKNIFVISSRPESGLASFPGFNFFTIKPLKKEESYELIKKYDQEGERSQQLIEKLINKEFTGVDEFLTNPLLATLLYRCYEYKQMLPLKNMSFIGKFLMLYLTGMMHQRMDTTQEKSPPNWI